MTNNLPPGTPAPANPELLLELLRYPMPFGKYKGRLLRELPTYYLEWFAKKGFPPGKLGMLLQTLYEIRINGLDYLLDELAKRR
ncbi:DUF3820 family protein [Spirosoma montaniterrae]|uniref:Cytoplasmic protein n=1 Tax=Spirosoma montaniterrae TaxID=1178516 RepID=A0A1P9WW44_9BACT|nr:DUF3820 family protein [Spirosoma montaniterrae]AQG79591.1 hypothetical protein AWR27_09795 [Spirosoma montaniterrae]